jgi:hypothetical protein
MLQRQSFRYTYLFLGFVKEYCGFSTMLIEAEGARLQREKRAPRANINIQI